MDVRVAAQVIYTLAYCVCVFFSAVFLPSFWIDSNIIYIYFFLDPYRAGRSRLKTEHPHIESTYVKGIQISWPSKRTGGSWTNVRKWEAILHNDDISFVYRCIGAGGNPFHWSVLYVYVDIYYTELMTWGTNEFLSIYSNLTYSHKMYL